MYNFIKQKKEKNMSKNNTGYRNTGDRNTGNWNRCNNETGFFNSSQGETVRVFNRRIHRDKWKECVKPAFINFDLTQWVYEKDMSDQEKIDNESFLTTGGYLKEYTYQDAFKKSWDEADEEDRNKLYDLPNFDAEVFKEISGIDVHDKQQSCISGKVIIIEGKKYKLEEV